jgi:hypothetical protein
VTLRGYETQGCRRQVTMRIDQDDAASVGSSLATTGATGTRQHQVVNETEHERGLAPTGLRDCEQMASQQTWRQGHGNAVSLVL